MIALHLMAALLLLVFPAWDYLEARHLRTTAAPQARSRCYIRAIAVLWLATFATLALLPFDTLWNASAPMRALMEGKISPDFYLVFVPAAALGVLMPLAIASLHAGMRRSLLAQFDAIDYLLPRTATDIALFAAVSVTAGICEEVLFRGFLFHYLEASWNLSPQTTLLLGSALFGLAHAGQGPRGMALTGIAGLVLGGLYLATGNLLAPIVLHILIDLRATGVAWLRTRHWGQTA